MEPIIIVNVFNQGTGKLLRPLSDENLTHYKTAAVDFAKTVNINYLCLGLEINLLFEKDPSNFDKFVKLFAETSRAIKSVSPKTKVFTTFQFEKMKGLHGGLFGGYNSENNSEWPLLDKFPDSSLIGLTTYPSLVYKTPKEIPDSYYSVISNQTQKPLAFVEIGWPADSRVPNWESDELEQAEFLDKFFKLTKSINKKI